MQPDKYPSTLSAAKETIYRYGLMGLYKGVAAPAIGNGFYNAIQFFVFARAKNFITDNGRNLELYRIAVAGGFTGIFVALIEGPQDLFKSQMQAQMKTGGESPSTVLYTSTGDCARKIWAQHGLTGVTQGLTATVARNIVGVSAYFYYYETMRSLLSNWSGKPVDQMSSFQVLMSGGCGGLGYWVLCYPLDIIKSAIQTDSINPSERKYKTIAQTAALLWKEGGVKRYTAGLAPCLLRSFPANAAGFAIYEATKKTFDA
jgi:solute carrier family 25 carnitine/acylcarnitine transporter 20/29